MEGRRTGFRQHRQLFGHTRRLQSRPLCQQPSQQPLLLLLTLLVAVLPVVLFKLTAINTVLINKHKYKPHIPCEPFAS